MVKDSSSDLQFVIAARRTAGPDSQSRNGWPVLAACRLGVSAPAVPALLFSGLAQAGENSAGPQARLRPSFPNYALAPIPSAPLATAGKRGAGRDNPSGPPDTEIPFSWPQTVVLHQGASYLYVVGGFDPGFQPVQFNMLPYTPVDMEVKSFDGNTGLMQATARPGTGGQIEVFSFQVTARGIQSPDVYPLTFDIRIKNSRVRGRPILAKTAGDFIRPGQMVRYVWTQSSRGERHPKVEAEFVGRTGPAKGLYSSVITEVLALKVEPMVLGHYLMTVTPRDVRGEPPRGSTSNGRVFRCAFGSQDLPPTTDGFAADTFTPATGQAVTLQPVAVDPQTGRSVFSNEFFDFGDGSVTSNANGSVAHAYNLAGVYRVSCTLMGDSGLTATAEDNVIVGATVVPKLPFKYLKQIIPDEAGTGLVGEDSFSVVFPGAEARRGDRIVFCFNRNRFGRLNASEGEDADIVLGPGGSFSGPTKLAKSVIVSSSGENLSIKVTSATLDRTGDPRLGRADPKGIFTNQRLAVGIVPADGSAPRALLYTGNVTLRVRGGALDQAAFVSEQSVYGASTARVPDPRKQEIAPVFLGLTPFGD